MSWLLDADVLSQLAKSRGDEQVIEWIEREKERCFTSAVVIAQLAAWVRSNDGRERAALQAWLSDVLSAMEGRVISFNVSIAHVWAEIWTDLRRQGRTMPLEDSYIAATARRHGLTIVTGNDKDFRRSGLKTFNPFRRHGQS